MRFEAGSQQSHSDSEPSNLLRDGFQSIILLISKTVISSTVCNDSKCDSLRGISSCYYHLIQLLTTCTNLQSLSTFLYGCETLITLYEILPSPILPFQACVYINNFAVVHGMVIYDVSLHVTMHYTNTDINVQAQGFQMFFGF